VLKQVAVVVEYGGVWVGQDLMHRLLSALARSAGRRNVLGLEKLTARERDVALAVAAGASNKEISRQLDITERTVKSHLSAIFRVLGVRDRLQLSVLINGIPASDGNRAKVPPR
jgi:DNA-binding NarL/FixJ family response regulator